MQPSDHSSLHDVISALVYSLAQPHAQAPSVQPPFNDLTQFIERQLAQMPDCLRLPMRTAARGFDAFGWLNGGGPFHSQSPERRQRQIEAWKNSRISFQRDLIRYFESLTLLALYSRLDSTPRSEVPEEQIVSPTDRELRAKVVIIGSGPGGAITGCLLAEAGRDVLMIEEGPYYSLRSASPFSKEEMLQKYRCGGQTVALGRNKIAYVEGRCVGGGSEINSGLYHRTPPDILERWRKEFQVAHLADAELAPHFEACERDLSVSLLPGPAPAASMRFHDSATRLGWKSLEVPRWYKYDRAASSETEGARQSMTETYIPRFLRAGGKLLPHTRVRQLRQEADRWSIDAHREGREVRIVADAVFLCAGAVQTPVLLRRSGITQNVGNSLQVHPTLKIAAQFREPINSLDPRVPVHQIKEFSPRLSFGPSISSAPYLALGLIDHPQAARQVSRDWAHLNMFYAMITSEGRGSVRTLPGFQDPVVRYALTETDRRNLAEGLRKLAELLFDAGATALYPSLSRGPELHCRDCLSTIPDVLPDGLANLMTIHLFSSCPMGENRSQCAADSFGRVHGFKNLFINDASLLCTAPGVNPQGSVMAVARRNAIHYLESN